MKNRLARIAIGIASGVSLAVIVSKYPGLLDPNAMIGIFAPLICFGLVYRKYGVSSAHLWEATGIPLAVMIASVGLIRMLHEEVDSSFVYTATGGVFAAIFWGGLAACLGYCLRPTYAEEACVPKVSKALLAILLLAFVLHEIEVAAGIMSFLLGDAVICVLLPAVLYAAVHSLNGNSVDASKCLQLVVLGCLGGVAIAIVQYLVSMSDMGESGVPQVGPALALGMLSIFYCAVVLLFTAAFLDNKARQSIAFSRLNWHLLEIFALFNLMVFAPMTLAELFGLIPE